MRVLGHSGSAQKGLGNERMQLNSRVFCCLIVLYFSMAKHITSNQTLGELGETAVRHRFLSMGFQFDSRSRLEAGIDGIAEVMRAGEPLARMIAVQVKTTASSKYASETDNGFTYLLRAADLNYWRGSNLPVIVVLYRQSDETFYWKEVGTGIGSDARKLEFSKTSDILDSGAVDRLAALTVPKAGQGYYVPPLGAGEEALINMLPVTLPHEIYVAPTPYSARQAMARVHDADGAARFDWVIKGGTFWSFHDPRKSSCIEIVEVDQVEAIETEILAYHEDIDEQNNFAFLLRQALDNQVSTELGWNKGDGIFYFRAEAPNTPRKFRYVSAMNQTESDVVNVARSKTDESVVSFVRHHAFRPRFELLLDQWFLVVTPTYHFTTNGFTAHSYPGALLAGKKRLDNNASLRGQLIMWHRFLSREDENQSSLFADKTEDSYRLSFGAPPVVELPNKVPEDAWKSPKKKTDQDENQTELELDEI